MTTWYISKSLDNYSEKLVSDLESKWKATSVYSFTEHCVRIQTSVVIDKMDDGVEINSIKFRSDIRTSSIIGNKIRSLSCLGELMR